MILPGDFFLPFGGKLDEENRWVKLTGFRGKQPKNQARGG